MAGADLATKHDLLEVETRLKGEMAQMRREILDGVQEMVRDAQTEILKAFLPFQEAQNIRLHTLEVKLINTETGLSERMAVVERRLAEIEKRLLMNRPAA